MIFKSKNSPLLVLIIILTTFVLPLWIIIQQEGELLIPIVFGFLPCIVCVPIFFMTDYTISGATLKIRSGLFYKKEIQINQIRKIEETRTLINAPAASLDRLEIFYAKMDSVVLSPKDKYGFIHEIRKINPEIQVKYRYDNKTLKTG